MPVQRGRKGGGNLEDRAPMVDFQRKKDAAGMKETAALSGGCREGGGLEFLQGDEPGRHKLKNAEKNEIRHGTLQKRSQDLNIYTFL